jgi:hypothetical protein
VSAACWRAGYWRNLAVLYRTVLLSSRLAVPWLECQSTIPFAQLSIGVSCSAGTVRRSDPSSLILVESSASICAARSCSPRPSTLRSYQVTIFSPERSTYGTRVAHTVLVQDNSHPNRCTRTRRRVLQSVACRVPARRRRRVRYACEVHCLQGRAASCSLRDAELSAPSSRQS